MGPFDQQEKVRLLTLPRSFRPMELETDHKAITASVSLLLSTVGPWLKPSAASSTKPEPKSDWAQPIRRVAELSDEVFFEHRRSNCMFHSPDQGKCGCCYVLASVAIMEWLHCTTTGKLLAFFEQYMIDCGSDKLNGLYMKGCNGTTEAAILHSIHTLGMELRVQYPHMGVEDVCYYPEEAGLTTTGFVRMLEISILSWAKYIEYSPLCGPCGRRQL